MVANVRAGERALDKKNPRCA